MRAKNRKAHRRDRGTRGRQRVRWTTWLIVGFALAAMILYVVSLDEAIIP